MSGVVVFGSQWGDEGQGRFVDFLAKDADMVIRYQGGNNAGHTVYANGVEFKLRTIPSGIISEMALSSIRSLCWQKSSMFGSAAHRQKTFLSAIALRSSCPTTL